MRQRESWPERLLRVQEEILEAPMFRRRRRMSQNTELSPVSLRKKLKAAGLDQNTARSPRPHLPAPQMDFARYESYLTARAIAEAIFRCASTPVKLPARRRRADRQMPKAA